MAKSLESRVEALESSQGRGSTEGVREVHRRWQEYQKELQAAKAAYQALSPKEKLAHKRAELAELDAKFLKSDHKSSNPAFYDRDTSTIELEIIELEGYARDHLNAARDWAQRRFWQHSSWGKPLPEGSKKRAPEPFDPELMRARRDARTPAEVAAEDAASKANWMVAREFALKARAQWRMWHDMKLGTATLVASMGKKVDTDDVIVKRPAYLPASGFVRRPSEDLPISDFTDEHARASVIFFEHMADQ